MSNSHQIRPRKNEPTRWWVQALTLILAFAALFWVPTAVVFSVVGLFTNQFLALLGGIMLGAAGVVIAISGIVIDRKRSKRNRTVK